MITTTTIWPKDGITLNPTPEQVIALREMADTLCGGNATSELSIVDQGNSVSATRTWPTLEVANAWVEYLLANNYNATCTITNE
jgi:hypothetical protein